MKEFMIDVVEGFGSCVWVLWIFVGAGIWAFTDYFLWDAALDLVCILAIGKVGCDLFWTIYKIWRKLV